MKLVLHNYWRSSCSHRVRIALNLKQQVYDYVKVNLVGNEQHAEAYRARNAMGQLPTLEVTEDDGTVRTIPQSLPILEYLEERFPEPPLLPRDRYLRARARGLAEIVNSGIQPHQNLSTTRKLERSESSRRGSRLPRGRVAAFARCHRTAPRSASGCTDDRDCCLIPQLVSARRFHVDYAHHELLVRIEQRCLALPAFAQAMPDQQPDAVKS